jgi:ribosome-binding factor A
VAFHLDRGLERGTSVLELLHRLEEERQERGELDPGADAGPSAPA